MARLKMLQRYSPLLIIIYIVVIGLIYLCVPDIITKVSLMPVFGNTLILLISIRFKFNYIVPLILTPYVIVILCSLRRKHKTVFLNIFSLLTLADAIAMIIYLMVNRGIGQLAESGVHYSTEMILVFCAAELLLAAAAKAGTTSTSTSTGDDFARKDSTGDGSGNSTGKGCHGDGYRDTFPQLLIPSAD